MFGLDPLSLPVAISEILLLLGFAAFVGWLLGRLVMSGRIATLRAAINHKEAELDECRRSKLVGSSDSDRFNAPVPAYPAPSTESQAPIPPSYVTADPLLPAFSFDDTPEPVAAPPEPTVNRPAYVVPPAPIMESVPTSMPAVGNSEAAVLNRIAARAGELNFDRIGRALPTEADDLKDIIGIGPFLERKLHSLGIFTYRQVSNFTKEDIDKVNEIIEFFPGRIERDNWVDQSKRFYERKYGANQ